MTSSQATRTAPRRVLAVAAVTLLALVALLTWAFASPVGSSPDDDFHLASSWCGGAAPSSVCAATGEADERLVSIDISLRSQCYVLDPTTSAECQGPDYGDDLTEEREATDRGNFSGIYPPVFYYTMSLFAGEDLQVSALTMRAVNSLLFVTLMLAIFLLLPPRRRPTLVLSAAVTMVPLGMFLVASNNPSSWAIISAATLWISLLGYFETSGVRRALLGTIAVVATVMGAGARADSAVYAGVAIVAVVALTARRTRGYWMSALLPAALGVIALAGFAVASQTSVTGEGLVTYDRPDRNVVALLANNLVQLPEMLLGSFGTWALGWLDTPMPPLVWFCTVGAFVVAMSIGIVSGNRRKTIVALGTLFLVAAVPMYILARSGAVVGEEVQPRYFLPLIVLFAGLMLLESPASPLRASALQVGAIAAALAVANSLALHTTLRRYVVGLDSDSPLLDADIEWWWNVGVSPMTVWFVGSVAFALLMAALAAVWLKSLPRRSAALGARSFESISAP